MARNDHFSFLSTWICKTTQFCHFWICFYPTTLYPREKPFRQRWDQTRPPTPQASTLSIMPLPLRAILLLTYINEWDESLSLPVDHLALVVDVLAALVLRDLLADLDVVVPASAAAQDGPEVDRQRHLKAGGQHEDAEDEFLKRGDF